MIFDVLPQAQSDPIFAVAKRAKQAGPEALNATIGVVLDDYGKPIVFKSIVNATKQWSTSFDAPQFSYPPLQGLPEYLDAVQSFVCPGVLAARSATAGGTGAMAVLLRLLKRMDIEEVVLPTPAWANHQPLLRGADLHIVDVPYFVDHQPSIDPCLEKLQSAEAPTALLLQAGCHNSTGRDLSNNQWQALSTALQNTPHIVVLDMAYQGFGKGIEQDTFPLQCLTKYNIPTLVAWSASKNHCLYGLRTGAAFAVTQSEKQAHDIEQHSGSIGRTLYSVAPTPGQHIVHLVQTEFRELWQQEMDTLRASLLRKREILAATLPASCRTYVQGHGMFTVLPLTEQQIEQLQQQKVFLTFDGRINIAGIPEKRMQEFGEKIASVLE